MRNPYYLVLVVAVCNGGVAAFCALQFDSLNQRLDGIRGGAEPARTAGYTVATGGSVTIGETTNRMAEEAAQRLGYYKTSDLARIHGVDERTVLRWIEDGRVDAIKYPGGWRIPLVYAVRQ